MSRGLVIRSRELGGKIVTLGDSHARGIVVEQPDFSANDWGSESGSFVLKRSPRVQWPDLRANAPIIVEDRGVPVWRGRIKQTPMTDGGLARSIGVNVEGQQFRLDDDVYERLYVSSDLSKWFDSRTKLGAVLGTGGFTVGGTAQRDNTGALLFGFGHGYTSAVNDVAGFEYDAGPNGLVGNLSFTLVSSNNNGSAMICRAYYSTDGVNYSLIFSRFLDSAVAPFVGPGPINFDLTGFIPAPGARYLAIQVQALAAYTVAVDAFVQMQSANVYGSTAYSSSGTSILVATNVVSDALDRATMQLSSDRSLITTTAFAIPECAMSSPQTPREVITGVNVFHDYQFRQRAIDNRPEYRPRPAVPLIEVGADSRFDEASAGDASEVYTGIVVVYTDAAGVEQRMVRSQPATLETASALQLTNPSATPVGTAGWVATGAGTLTRDTGVFDSAPASFKIALGAYAGLFSGGIFSNMWVAGTWIPARSYVLSGMLRMDNPSGLVAPPEIRVSDGGTFAYVGRTTLPGIVANTQTPFRIPFTLQNAIAPHVSGNFYAAGACNVWLDSLVLTEAAPTIVDQWGFKRTKVLDTGMSLTPAGAQQIADTFLLGHRTTPLKGSLVIAGDGRARRMPSGQPMRCSDLLEDVGELVRLRHIVDPETGKVGRIGRIASVSWDASANVATCAIDSTTRNFEAMVKRMALLTSQVRS